VDQHGQVIDVLVSERRNGAAARAFFTRALRRGPSPVEVTTDRAPVYPRVIDELVPAARHVLEQCPNNRVEADNGRLKARLRPMRGVKTMRSLRTVAARHAPGSSWPRSRRRFTAPRSAGSWRFDLTRADGAAQWRLLVSGCPPVRPRRSPPRRRRSPRCRVPRSGRRCEHNHHRDAVDAAAIEAEGGDQG
jgi:hypothetical protein